jgi:PAS domain S-box-containing protein
MELEKIISTIHTGQKYRTRTTQLKWDGTEFPVEINALPFQLKGEKCILTVIKDISEQIKFENEIHQKQMDLLALVTSLEDVIFELNEYYIFLNVWTKDESVLFMPKERFLGKHIKEVFGEDFYMPFKNTIDQVISTSQSQSIEYPSIVDKGEWKKATINLLKTAEGAIRKVSIIIKDISEQKKEEKAARENFELFRLVAENIAVGVVITRLRDGIIIFTNDSMANMMKLKKEDIINSTSLILYKYPEDRLRFMELIRKNGTVMNFETTGIRSDGVELAGLLNGTICTYLGEPVFIGLVLDISELKKAEKTVKEKDRMLVESKLAALRAQMNPHFIFNAINSIQQLVLSGSREIAYDYFSKFSSLVRNVLDHSDKLLIPIEDELNSLKLYIEIEALRFDDKFEYSLNADSGLLNSGCKIPPLLFQPFVENAIWHGLLHKKNDRKLIINLTEKENDLLYCMIEDNGIGRKQSKENKEKEISTHTSKGIDVTLERMHLLNNIHDNITDFKIIDLYTNTGESNGTRVEFFITLK